MSLQAWARFLLVLVLVAVIQVGVLNSIVVGGAHADLFLLVAVVAGYLGGPQHGATMAFVTGLVADLFLPTPYGLSSLCFVLIAFGVGLAAGLPGGRSPYSLRVGTAVLGSLGGTLLFAAVETLIGQPHPLLRQLVMVCAVVTVGNAVLAVPAFALVRRALTVGPSGQRETATLGGMR